MLWLWLCSSFAIRNALIRIEIIRLKIKLILWECAWIQSMCKWSCNVDRCNDMANEIIAPLCYIFRDTFLTHTHSPLECALCVCVCEFGDEKKWEPRIRWRRRPSSVISSICMRSFVGFHSRSHSYFVGDLSRSQNPFFGKRFTKDQRLFNFATLRGCARACCIRVCFVRLVDGKYANCEYCWGRDMALFLYDALHPAYLHIGTAE